MAKLVPNGISDSETDLPKVFPYTTSSSYRTILAIQLWKPHEISSARVSLNYRFHSSISDRIE
jgi:hypothetical protein